MNIPRPGVYYPERHLRFRPFMEECAAIDRMAERVPELIVSGGLTHEQAFFEAWADEHPSPMGFRPPLGPSEMFGLAQTMLLRAQTYLDYFRNKYLWAIADTFQPINDAINPVDPLTLLELTRVGVGRSGTRVHRQARWESKVILAISFGFIAMKLAHPEEWIADEVTTIDRMSRSQLFTPDDLVDVYAVYAIDRNNKGRIVGAPFVTLDEQEALAELERLRERCAEGVIATMFNYECRTITDGEYRFYTYNDSRRKSTNSRQFKYQDNCNHDAVAVRDACGTGYVIVATQGSGGALRVATREDVEMVRDLTQQRLWSGLDLYLVPRQSSSRHRNRDYWDVKLVGRLRVWHGSQEVHAFVEQIFTSVTDHINQRNAMDALNHEIRRGQQLAIRNPRHPERIPMAWQYWPEEIYPRVRWTSPETVELLQQSWKARFAGKVV